ncbi:phosphomannose isomerase type II C-terminal cupin domain [Candidatus Kaiserbacteria bacterium]|nr:phosphomannose isomerase type II C-terminal cupin domain [Candidatus Kaiserbacteria bacterium]
MTFLQQRTKEERPWGSFERFTANESSTVKIIRVLAGKELSLQKHEARSEFWRVLEGTGVVTIGTEAYPATAGDEFEIGATTPHRLAAGKSGITILEIAFGHFDENDEVRLADDYGRGSPEAGAAAIGQI